MNWRRTQMTNKKMLLLCSDEASVDGCDISYYQGNIDFKVMKAAGIKVVIIRAGYGTTIDKRFISYINAAIKAGLAVGIYWFIYAADMAGIERNAQKCIEIVAPYKQYITCGVWCDWEYDSDRYAGILTSEERSNMVNAFNQKIEKAGYESGIYSNQDYIQSEKFTTWLISKYPLWFAKYALVKGKYASKGKKGRSYLWQYSSDGNGSRYGVSSKKLDLNKVYINITCEETTPPSDKVTETPASIKACNNPYIEPTRVIFYNAGKSYMYGDDIKWVQWHLWRFGLFLNSLGLPDASQIDGIWGAKSDSAFAIAQERLGLAIDRKCGRVSREKFKKV